MPPVPPPLQPNPPVRPPAENAGQKATELIHDYGPAVLWTTTVIAMAVSGSDEGANQEEATQIARQIRAREAMAQQQWNRAADAVAEGDMNAAVIWGDLAQMHEDEIARLRDRLSELGW